MIKKQKNNVTNNATKGSKDSSSQQQNSSNTKHIKKLSEYGKQLAEKQKLKKMYGMREKQFRNFFKVAKKSKDATGSMLLTLLERRLDNVVFRLKFSKTRTQSRQMVVHGHIMLNGKRVYSPSMLVKIGDLVTLKSSSIEKSGFMNEIINKAMVVAVKVPEWIELNKNNHEGRVLRMPVKDDIQATINENIIVELYSKLKIK